jgi:LacI family transcriptional regulator
VVDVPRLRRDLPVVLLDATPAAERAGERSKAAHARPPEAGGPTPFVAPDEVGGAVSAVTELLDHGHRRIGLATLASPVPAAEGRLRGYRETLAAAGIPFDPALVVFDQTDASGGYHAVGRLLDGPDPPTAVFCFNDEMAMGAYRAAAERGLRIPDDLSLVGYNDIPIVSRLPVPLTTVRVPFQQIATNALELLREANDGVQPRTLVAAPTLIPRASTIAAR